MTRRSALQAFSAAMSLPALGGCASERESQKIGRLERYGLGLYTVRGLMEEDPIKTLRAITDMGFNEVEFTAQGYYGHSPSETKSILSDLNLTAPSRLVRLPHIRDNLERTLEGALQAGHSYVVLAYLKNTERRSLDDYKSYVDLFSQVGEQANSYGLKFGYHNHAFEFEPMDGLIPYDLLLDQISADHMTLTMDTFHFATAGVDPIPYLSRYPGRFSQIHIKDRSVSGDMVDPGMGNVDFPAIFAANRPGGFEHAFYEDRRDHDPLGMSAAALGYMKSLEWSA